MEKRTIKDWTAVKEDLLMAILKSEPTILNDKNLEFRVGNTPKVAIAFKYGFIGIDQGDLLVLALKRSIPQALAVRFIDVVIKHCNSQKMNVVAVSLDEHGLTVGTDQCLILRV